MPLYSTSNAPNPDASYNSVDPVTDTLPDPGAVHRNTAPLYDPLYPWTNPLPQMARYSSLPSHFDAPALYVSKFPPVSR